MEPRSDGVWLGARLLKHRETAMAEHTHAIVWIDHKEARIFHFNAEDVERLVLHPHHPSRHIHHHANSIGSGHAAEDHKFLQSVVEGIGPASAVLITGPANAKTELVKHIESHAPALKKAIAGVETLDHPSDGELVAHARRYFHADHQMPPRAG